MTQTNSAELKPYIDANWQLIPLHRWSHVDKIKGKPRKRGKTPIHWNWTKRPYKSCEQLAHMDSGANVGVRLRAEDLILDVDPRNFEKGDDPLARLCADCEFDIYDYPVVETGSGGLHVYMKKPDDVSIRDSHHDYVGLEFKTIGRQVVSAGSVHQDTGKNYLWDAISMELTGVSAAPEMLINIVKRPSGAAATGGGEYDQDELSKMLSALDPEEFRLHDDWLMLMQACHHATAGDGRAEFIDWSTQDPQYGNCGGEIGRRWDSLHADTDGRPAVTYRTLLKILLDKGQEKAIIQKSASDDFKSIDDQELFAENMAVEEHEQKGPLDLMNEKYFATMDNGQFRVYWQEEDPEFFDVNTGKPIRDRWVQARATDFKYMLSHRRIQNGDRTTPIADAWLGWGKRRSAKGVIFDPERDHEGFLNLWTGWQFEPSKHGSWEYLRELLYEVLCNGEDKVYQYMLNWAAYMVQHPGKPAEVAVCFQGGKGIGKGTWGRALATLAGRHGMQITSPQQLTGRFNLHLRDIITLFADEAIRPFHAESESILKGALTEPRLTYEGKGKDAISGPNRLHVIMASNEDWFVPAGLDFERRFVVQKSNNKWQGKHGKFTKLYAELNSGGYAALLWDLLKHDIHNWAPRLDMPITQALIEQKLNNMDPEQQWWYNILIAGDLGMECVSPESDWSKDSVMVYTQDVRESFQYFCRENGIRSAGAMGRSSEVLFGRKLGKLIPGLVTKLATVSEIRMDIKSGRGNRARAYLLPPLGDCRVAMESLLGGKIDWDII